MVLPIRLILTWNAKVTFVLGSFLNVLLLYLAKCHSKGDLSGYRWVLLYFGVLNFVLIALQTVAQQVFFVSKDLVSYNFVFGLAAQIPSGHIRLLIYCLYIYCLTLTVASLALQFLDRYLVICRSHSSQVHRFLAWTLIALCYMSVSDGTLSLIQGLTTMDPKDRRTTRNLLGQDDIFTEDDHRRMAIFIENHSNDSILVTVFYVCSLTGFLLCYGAILFCYFAIRGFIKLNLKPSNIRSRELSRQISNNMLLQAIVPFYCLAIGLMAIVPQITGQYSSALLQIESLTFLPLNWLPVLNPLVTIVTIREYRMAFLGLMGIAKKRRPVSNIVITTGGL